MSAAKYIKLHIIIPNAYLACTAIDCCYSFLIDCDHMSKVSDTESSKYDILYNWCPKNKSLLIASAFYNVSLFMC